MPNHDMNRIRSGKVIVLANTGEHNPATANNIGTRTDQIDLGDGPVGSGAARQSTKFDFANGDPGADWALEWNLGAVIEFATAPAAGTNMKFYLGYSPSATAGTGESAEITGADGAWTGTTGGSVANSAALLHLIGTMTLDVSTSGAAQVNTSIAKFVPRLRYATLVVVNNSGVALIGDAVEQSIALTPMEYSIRD